MELRDQLTHEAAIIGKAIEYLEEERNSIVDSYTNPGTGKVEDEEGIKWIEEIQALINGLSEGTVAGRAYMQAKQTDYPTVNPKLIAEAWQEFCDNYPNYS